MSADAPGPARGRRAENRPRDGAFNRSVAHFAFDQARPIEAQARANYAKSPIPELPADQFRVRGDLTFAGAGGNPRTCWNGEKNNFMPRIGLAYQLPPKTVLRAGYGIFRCFAVQP